MIAGLSNMGLGSQNLGGRRDIPNTFGLISKIPPVSTQISHSARVMSVIVFGAIPAL
jgi:hypothetical protein